MVVQGAKSSLEEDMKTCLWWRGLCCRVNVLSWDTSDTLLASPLPPSQHLPGPWPKCSTARECISEKWDEIVRIDGSPQS